MTALIIRLWLLVFALREHWIELRAAYYYHAPIRALGIELRFRRWKIKRQY